MEMKALKNKNTRRIRVADKIILFGIAIGVFYWILESVMHSLLFNRGNILENLFPTDPNELWMRSTFVCMLIAFGLYARFIMKRLERAEKSWQEVEERYQRLSEVTREGIILHDKGVLVDINFAFAKMLGYEIEEILGKNLLDILILPGNRDIALKKAVAGYNKPYEILAQRKDGTVLPVEMESREVHYQDAIFGVTSIKDITERKKAEDILRESEEKYRSLVENVPDIIYTIDKNGHFTSINEYGLKLLGYQQDELIGQHIVKVIHPDDVEMTLQVSEKAVFSKKQKPHDHMFRLLTRDRRSIWISVNSRMIFDENGNFLQEQGVARDITEHKKLEEKFYQSQKLDAIGKLAGGVAHDFNNLLTVICGYTDIILSSLETDNTLRDAVQEIKQAGKRAALLIDQLLSFSRKQIRQPKVLNLNNLVMNTEKMLQRLIGDDIELVTFWDKDLWNIKADPGQMEQIILNLAINARDAMPEGGKLTIETGNVYLDSKYNPLLEVNPGNYAMIAISDTGSGMDQEVIPHIFEPFFTTKEKGKGTGLGLSTVYGIVKQSEGYIFAYSEVDKGTILKIYFPRLEEAQLEWAGETTNEESSIAEHFGGSETILLAEDDKLVCNFIKRILEKYGYIVLTAHNGEEALQTAKDYQKNVQFLVTDVVMPKMSGKELAEKLTNHYPQMKVLFLSGYAENTIVHHGVLDEGINFLQKPFSTESLLRRIRKSLDDEKS